MNKQDKINRRREHDELMRLIVGKQHLVPGLILFQNHHEGRDIRTGRNRVFSLGPGTPDIVGFRAVPVADLVRAGVETVAQFVGVEVKTGRAALQTNQATWKRHILQHGGLYLVANSTDCLEWLNVRI